MPSPITRQARSKLTIAERIEALCVPEPNSGCWLWLGHSNSKGYGSITINGRNIKAHRLTYEMKHGPIPDGLVIDHLCRVRCCVNPCHMEAVTTRENILRGASPVALRAKQTHCHRGHPLSGTNLRSRPNGRNCKVCRRLETKSYYYRKKARKALDGQENIK